MEQQPVQLRLGFQSPTREQRIEIQLSGLSVVVAPADGDHAVAAAYLASVGVASRLEVDRGLLMQVRDLPLLASLPGTVDLVALDEVRVLLELVRNLPDQGLPVHLSIDGPGALNLSWLAGGRDFNEPLPLSCVPALTSMNIPLLASDGTWDELSAAVQLPLALARARVNIDGFVELASLSPTRLEMAPIRGLFRLDATRFGVPLQYAQDVARVPGITWEGPVPTYDPPPSSPGPLPISLSEHAEADLATLTTQLARSRGSVVAWSSGLGRRVFCAAAVTRLEAFPLLVVTRPGAVWAWKRTWEMLGHSVSVADDDADVRILTYQEAARHPRLPSPAAVIFDDADIVATREPRLLAALRSLDGLADIYRIACTRALPPAQDAVIEMLSVVRPVEFKPGVPALVRYPGDARTRLQDHVSCYSSVRTSGSVPDGWPRNRVIAVELPAELQGVYQQARAGAGALSALQEIASRGSETVLGPKVGLVLQEVAAARRAGRSIAVLTRFDETAELLRNLLLGVPEATTGAVVLVGPERWQEARGYDSVLVVDYPERMSDLDSVIGASGAPGSTQTVILLHLEGSVDDRLAMAALLVDEGHLSPAELPAYVLAP